ncbi:MAG: Nmad5 family putative nucleotide modification protein [Pseudomonadota bacterium]|nr:Nmad5 family putative nucleotide modification protein [Pseudomonadota bacterium]
MAKNVKLSNYVRDQIVTNATRGAFEKELLAHKKRLVKLADQCYRFVVSAAQEKQARLAPDDFLNLSNVTRIYFKDPVTGHNRDTMYDVDLSRAVPFPHGGKYLHVNDDALHAEYRTITEAGADLDKKIEELHTSVKRTVYSTTSLNKLIEMWPEVEAFLPAELTAPKAMLPALPVGDLNAALRNAGIKVGVIKPAKATGGLVLVAA